MDAIDRHILTTLQSDGRTSNAEIARQVGMAPSAVLERIRKLESRGMIRGYEARLDPPQLGLGLLAFIFARAQEEPGSIDAAHRLAELPEVLEVHHIAGEDCYVAKVRAADTQSLADTLRKAQRAIPSIVSTRTTIVLETIKETSALPIPDPAVMETPESPESDAEHRPSAVEV